MTMHCPPSVTSPSPVRASSAAVPLVRRPARRLAVGAALAGLPALALAHPGAGAHDGLLVGFMHPLNGADHLAAMLAVGLWTALAARRGRADLLLAPLSFVALMVTGALFTQAGLTLPATEPVIALSLLALGLLVATRAHWPLPAVLPAVGVFAFFHGGAHGAELVGAAALVGMVLGSALLHAVGVVAGLTVRHRSRWLPRLAGAAVGLLGLGLLVDLVR
jgi:urease accessory protein